MDEPVILTRQQLAENADKDHERRVKAQEAQNEADNQTRSKIAELEAKRDEMLKARNDKGVARADEWRKEKDALDKINVEIARQRKLLNPHEVYVHPELPPLSEESLAQRDANIKRQREDAEDASSPTKADKWP